MEKTQTIKVVDFTEYPGPRYCDQGKSSGEEFYHSVLNSQFAESLKKGSNLAVDLDGTAGYASSFLDEAFGNLIYDFTLEQVKNHLKIISTEEKDWITMISEMVFPDWEERRNTEKKPKKTGEHPAWYRFVNGKLESKKWY